MYGGRDTRGAARRRRRRRRRGRVRSHNELLRGIITSDVYVKEISK